MVVNASEPDEIMPKSNNDTHRPAARGRPPAAGREYSLLPAGDTQVHMGMSPEARRRLDDGLRRRKDERNEQFAARWQDAVRLGEHLGLVQAVGIYRTEVDPPVGVRAVLRMLAPIPAVVVVVLLAATVRPGVLVPLIMLVPFAVGGWVFVCFIAIRRNRFDRWLYGYTGGFAELDPGVQPRVVRWDDVTDVVDEWVSASSESMGLWDYVGYRLTTTSGEVVSITSRYRNMLDPYAPIGRVIAGMLPAQAGSVIPRLPTIAELVAGQAVSRIVARQAAALRNGTVVVRGGVRVTWEGIAEPKDIGALPWAAIERIAFQPGKMQVFPIGGKRRTYNNYVDGSGFGVLCRLLAELGISASFDPTG
jgi:hypothetical protein